MGEDGRARPAHGRPSGTGKLTGLTDTARAPLGVSAGEGAAGPDGEERGLGEDAGRRVRPGEARGERDAPVAAGAREETLIRRATFDLIGLPPTPEEVEAFVNDTSPDAFAKVVDRLLPRPHYGERWGRYWLDVARYADTNGDENNNEGRLPLPLRLDLPRLRHPGVQRRMPYDQFLMEQIAADLLPDAKDDPTRLAALGFLTVGKRFQNPNDMIDDRIDAVDQGHARR